MPILIAPPANNFMPKGYIPQKVHRTFNGRESEKQIAVKFLQDRNPFAARILLIHGPRGVGKTAFACNIAHLVNGDENGSFAEFKHLLWVDRTNFTSFLAACTEKSDSTSALDIDAESFSDDNYQSISRSIANKRRAEKEEQEKQKQYIKLLLDESHYLLIIDDFDEEEPLTGVPDICEQLEMLSEPPNKVIVTARLGDDGAFAALSPQKLEIGLLSKQELAEIVINSLKDCTAFRGDIESVIEYTWKKTGGLAEFAKNFLIPIIEGGKYLLTDKRLEQYFDKCVESYLLCREQPRNLHGYINSTNPSEKTLDDVIRKMQPLARMILWKWINLEELRLDRNLSDKELGELLGFFMEDSELAADFHHALSDLTYYRFILPRHNNSREEHTKTRLYKTWVLIPIVQEYLQKHWTASEELMLAEEEHLVRFLNGYLNQNNGISIIKKHLGRCCQVFEWVYTQKNMQVAQELGELICKAILLNISGDELMDNKLLDVARKTYDVLQQAIFSDTNLAAQKWLLLGNLFLKAKQNEYAEMCISHIRCLPENSVTDEWRSATVLLAALSIEKADLETAANLLEQIVPSQFDAAWAEASYELATKYIERGEYYFSFVWYANVIRNVNIHNDIEHTLKSCYQVARMMQFVLHPKNDEIMALLKIGTKIAQEKKNQEKFPEDAAGTLCWYAAYLELDGQKKQARSMLEYVSSEILKPYLQSSPISFFVDERLIYMSQSTFPTLSDGLKAIPIKGEIPLAGIFEKLDSADKLICPLCKKEIDNTSDDLYICQSCQTPYHLSHLKEMQTEVCVLCNSPIRSHL